jgi:intracellular septation protein
MKFLFELLPLVAFFSVYKMAGIQAATLAALCATALQVGWLKLRRQTVTPMQWFSLGILILFGGATLLHHDARFIQWKPTALYGLMAAGLVLAPRITRRNPLQALLGAQIQLPEPVWRRLTHAWVIFFIGLATLNLYVAHTYPLDIWVDFKLFGTLGLTLLFIIIQALWMSRHLKEATDAPK